MKIFVILILFSIVSCSHRNPTIKVDKKTQAIEIIEQLMLDTNASGVSVSIGLKNKIIWSEGFGYSDLEQRVIVTPSKSLFRIGSISKPITSIAIGLLYERGLLDINKPVQHYVPSFPIKKKGEITTRLLASHMAGVRHYNKREELLNVKKYSSVLDGLTIFQEDELLYEPGSRYYYSSYGWNLISAVIESASGHNFLDYMTRNVFTPLKLDQVIADQTEKLIPNRGRYYEIVDNEIANAPFVDNSYKWASGGYLSTSEELVRFGMSFLSQPILKKETVDLLWQSQQSASGYRTGYGFGWKSGTINGRSWVGHDGNSIGGTAYFRIYPKEELVIVFLSNTSGLQMGVAPQKIAEIFMDCVSGEELTR